MTAHHFLITRLDVGTLVGHALICVQMRYASVRWRAADQLRPCFGGPGMWRTVESELREGWDAGLVDHTSATFGLIVPMDRLADVIVQQYADLLIERTRAARTCDHYLRQQVWT